MPRRCRGAASVSRSTRGRSLVQSRVRPSPESAHTARFLNALTQAARRREPAVSTLCQRKRRRPRSPSAGERTGRPARLSSQPANRPRGPATGASGGARRRRSPRRRSARGAGSRSRGTRPAGAGGERGRGLREGARPGLCGRGAGGRSRRASACRSRRTSPPRSPRSRAPFRVPHQVVAVGMDVLQQLEVVRGPAYRDARPGARLGKPAVLEEDPLELPEHDLEHSASAERGTRAMSSVTSASIHSAPPRRASAVRW